MQIKKLKLFTDQLNAEKIFYTQTLGFELVEEDDLSFTVKIGWSTLTFEKSDAVCRYHYCFLIPSNTLHSALQWMEQKVEVLDIESGRKIQRFETWNADSFYFYDASGNLAEFIVRYDLKNNISHDFSISDVICVNEIGMPTSHVEETNRMLEDAMGTVFWKGDLERFGTHGSQKGLILLPNFEVKEIWFPTQLKIRPYPFTAQIENQGKKFVLSFADEQIEIYDERLD